MPELACLVLARIFELLLLLGRDGTVETLLQLDGGASVLEFFAHLDGQHSDTGTTDLLASGKCGRIPIRDVADHPGAIRKAFASWLGSSRHDEDTEILLDLKTVMSIILGQGGKYDQACANHETHRANRLYPKTC